MRDTDTVLQEGMASLSEMLVAGLRRAAELEVEIERFRPFETFPSFLR